MRQEPPAAKRGSWPGLILWAALIVASIVLMSIGLWRAMFFGFMPDPALVEDLRVGGLYILAGALASLAAVSWSVIMRHPRWVIAFVAAPAVLVGGAALIEPTSLIRHGATGGQRRKADVGRDVDGLQGAGRYPFKVPLADPQTTQ